MLDKVSAFFSEDVGDVPGDLVDSFNLNLVFFGSIFNLHNAVQLVKEH
jgi:hypothetical protein